MAKKGHLHRLKRKYGERRGGSAESALPSAIPVEPTQRLIKVFVEGYEDVAFWRGVFDHFSNPLLRFEISVPLRKDLPKGKKILLGMIDNSLPYQLLCVDSDFDHLFHNSTQQSREVNSAKYMLHTYTYATENYLCYAPSLHNVCVKATKNDTNIFDFERFLRRYSEAIYPAFLWYLFSAQLASENFFTLSDFKATVRIGYLNIENSGDETVEWVSRNVAKRVAHLESKYFEMSERIHNFRDEIERRGVTSSNCYLYMHGHTLMDNVVMIALTAVCDKLRQMTLSRIISSTKEGTALKNEISNYNNTQRSIRDVLLDNENYTSCHLYQSLREDISRYVNEVTAQIERENRK